jgi:formylglycine-generating enzyme required for sulfatase activity
VYSHLCKKLGIQFWSPRHDCPFCLQSIGPSTSFPALASVFLKRVIGKEKLSVAFDILDIENNLLVPSIDGDFLLIGNGATQEPSLILPARTCFADKEDFESYSALYDCEKPQAGEVRILSPAVADKLPGGWRPRERGRLEIVSAQLGIGASETVEGFPTSVAAYQKSIDLLNVVAHDLVDNTLKLAPGGELILGSDPALIGTQSWYVVPRLTNFPGKQGFLKYFDIYYEPYYYCDHPDSGDLWIIDPAVVTKTDHGWQLCRTGTLEVRNKSDGVPLVPTPVIPVRDNGSRVVEEVKISKEYPFGDAAPAPVPPRPLLPRALKVGLLVIVVFFSFYGATALVKNLVSSIKPDGNQNGQTPTPTPKIPRITPAGMVDVAGGEFLMGTNAGQDEYVKPAHAVTVKPFYIDIYEVTCEDYQKFVKATSHRIPPNWINGQFPNGATKQPVTGVDWDDANAYARWAGKRLPTEEEWEFAARGTDGRRYPWGNEWKNEAANAANTAHRHLAEVGEHSQGASPFGAFDMVGNAWEWTASPLTPYPGGHLPPQGAGELMVIRGGSWQSDKASATTTYRWGWPARGGKDYRNTGFRCAKNVTQEPGR